MRKNFCKSIQQLVLLLSFFGFAPLVFSAEQILPYQEIGPGVEYVNQWIRDVPWSIHVVKIDRNRGDLKFVTTKALGKVYGLSSLPNQIMSIPRERGHAVAAINGDFFAWKNNSFAGDPRGLHIVDGELISAPSDHACFWMEGSTPKLGGVVSKLKVTWPDGTELPIGLNEERTENAAVLMTPTLGKSTRTTNGIELILEKIHGDWLPLRAGKTYFARVGQIAGTNTPLAPNILVLSLGPKVRLPELKAGMRLQISTETKPDLGEVKLALGGGPILVHRGKVLPREVVSQTPARVEARHPRTAFGWNKSHYFFLVVDGRRKNVSDGMTFPELAREMTALGCEEAINFDGGGSSTIWAGGKVLNQPSDNKLRSVANALICVRQIP